MDKKKIIYCGKYREIEIPQVGIAKHGEPIEVPATLADELLKRAGHWKAEAPKAKAEKKGAE